MVNKQYNVQNLNKNKNANKTSITVISTIPNLNQSSLLSPTTKNSSLSDSHQSPFERNITQQQQHYYNADADAYDIVDDDEDEQNGTYNIDSSDIDPIASINSSVIGATTHDSHKNLSINDIGRFQYILQMDREMVRDFWIFFSFFFNFLIWSSGFHSS